MFKQTFLAAAILTFGLAGQAEHENGGSKKSFLEHDAAS